MKQYSFYIALAIMGTFIALLVMSMKPLQKIPENGLVTVDPVGSHKRLQLEAANTPELRAKGLKGHAPLQGDQGMLLVYMDQRKQCISNEGVNFPVDAAFFDAQWRLLNGATFLPNDSRKACSKEPISYVMLMRAGWFKERMGK